jgi:hypothetical protein
VAEDQVVLTFRRTAVMAGDDLVVGAVDADPQRPDEYLARVRLRSRHLQQAGLVCAWFDTDSIHE